MKLRHATITMLMLLTAVPTPAQDKNDMRQIYAQAENAYRSGQLEGAIGLIEKHLDLFSDNLRQNALRLVALSYLALDDDTQCEYYARQLLGINPYYTSVQDPVRFEEVIARLKQGQMTTITTASSQTESISEAPVPVTIITREMIDQLSNNKSLGQILAFYVPGLCEVAAYSMTNVAMHGVYTASQEKILVMENGHRLNMRSTNNGKLDYALSTEKIDHIEVLRGPASSLYGNVALTAVVNIITRPGNTVGGVKAKYGYGTNATHRADITAGTALLGADMMAWASFYSTDGQRISVPRLTGYSKTPHDGYTYVGRYKDTPSYDIGCNVSIGDFTFLFSRKSGKQVPQYSWFAETYDYDSYRDINGVKPGYTTNETHLELEYAHSLGSVAKLNVAAYADKYDIDDYMAVSDSTVGYVFDDDGGVIVIDGQPLTKTVHGLSQYLNFKEFTVGATVKVDAGYHLGTMTGNLLAGAQYELFKLSSNDFAIGEEYTKIAMVRPVATNMLRIDHEESLSYFMQDKHYFTPQLIMNVGMRYDYKLRANDRHVSALSPRMALIYMPSKSFSAKLSYAEAFVDAPYYTRHNATNGARGSENLLPEYMNAIQLGVTGSAERLHLDYEVNLFYNHLKDLIINNPSTDPVTPKYINAGSVRVAGIEGSVSFRRPSLQLTANATCQKAIDAEAYYYADHRIYSVPSFMGALAARQRLLHRKGHELWVNASASYRSSTLNKANSRIPGSSDFTLSAYTVVDAGLRYSYGENFQLALDCDNLFDTTNLIGGSFYLPYRLLGRMAMATVTLKY